MTHNDSLPDLSTTKLIGLLGDTHGERGHVLTVSETMWARGVSVLVVPGDFGFIWPGHNWSKDLDKLSRKLGERGQVLYWLDGNHEDFDSLYGKFSLSEDGVRRLRHNIIHLPRGHRAVLRSGKSLAVLGGANSIDQFHHTMGRGWWADEQITDQDLDALGHEHAEIMVGHDAPTPLPSLDASLAKSDYLWPTPMLIYSAAGRQKFTEGFLQVRPSLYFGGHFHQFIDETVVYGEGEDAFETRVVILAMKGPTTLSQAVLIVETLEVEAFVRTEAIVTRLTGAETGLWHVHTVGSLHVFDLDAGTVERRPGAGAAILDSVGPRPLRSIIHCAVEAGGEWEIESDDFRFEYFRHSSSTIERVERIERKP